MSQNVVMENGNGAAQQVTPVIQETETAPQPKKVSRRRWLVLLAICCLAAGAFYWKGLPLVHGLLTHVTTDDAYVTGNATQVSARITDQVGDVMVNDNDFVEKGTVLVRLDRQPFVITVEQKRSALHQARVNVEQLVAALETARTQLEQTHYDVRAALAGLHEAWRGIQGRQDQVRYRIASLRAEIAGWRARRRQVLRSHSGSTTVFASLSRSNRPRRRNSTSEQPR